LKINFVNTLKGVDIILLEVLDIENKS